MRIVFNEEIPHEFLDPDHKPVGSIHLVGIKSNEGSMHIYTPWKAWFSSRFCKDVSFDRENYEQGYKLAVQEVAIYLGGTLSAVYGRPWKKNIFVVVPQISRKDTIVERKAPDVPGAKEGLLGKIGRFLHIDTLTPKFILPACVVDYTANVYRLRREEDNVFLDTLMDDLFFSDKLSPENSKGGPFLMESDCNFFATLMKTVYGSFKDYYAVKGLGRLCSPDTPTHEISLDRLWMYSHNLGVEVNRFLASIEPRFPRSKYGVIDLELPRFDALVEKTEKALLAQGYRDSNSISTLQEVALLDPSLATHLHKLSPMNPYIPIGVLTGNLTLAEARRARALAKRTTAPPNRPYNIYGGGIFVTSVDEYSLQPLDDEGETIGNPIPLGVHLNPLRRTHYHKNFPFLKLDPAGVAIPSSENLLTSNGSDHSFLPQFPYLDEALISV